MSARRAGFLAAGGGGVAGAVAQGLGAGCAREGGDGERKPSVRDIGRGRLGVGGVAWGGRGRDKAGVHRRRFGQEERRRRTADAGRRRLGRALRRCQSRTRARAASRVPEKEIAGSDLSGCGFYRDAACDQSSGQTRGRPRSAQRGPRCPFRAQSLRALLPFSSGSAPVCSAHGTAARRRRVGARLRRPQQPRKASSGGRRATGRVIHADWSARLDYMCSSGYVMPGEGGV